MKLRKYKDMDAVGAEGYHYWCPACDTAHGFRIPPWRFNGNLEFPTVEGSILATWANGERHCHCYIVNGKIQFLDDCKHEFKGKTVEIPEWPFE